MSLDVYNTNPTSADAAIITSSYFADQGKHDLALLLCDEAKRLDVSHNNQLKILERESISGFYSNSINRINNGKIACDTLSLDRNYPWQIRNLARQNGTFYAKSAKELMPKTEIFEFQFATENNYKPMNPSVASINNELYMIQRTVNYLITENGSYDMQGDSAIRTVNYLLKLNSDLTLNTLFEILPPKNLPTPLYDQVIGWEDCRLFSVNNELYCTSTVRQLNQEGICEIVLSKIVDDEEDKSKKRFSDYKVIRPNFVEKQHEKNWMPMVVDNTIFFVYSCDPTRVIDAFGNMVTTSVPNIAVDSFRGGSQLIAFHGGWLALIHESHGMPNYQRRYMHRWVWFDAYGRLARYSDSFYFKKIGIEFAAGLAQHPATGKLIASFGVDDRSSWLASFDQNNIKKILKPAGDVFRVLPTDNEATTFVLSQTNSALKNKNIVDKCIQYINNSTLPKHQDFPKNWDNFLAVYHTAFTTDIADPVLDIAATTESAYLPSLKKLGFNKLMTINLTQDKDEIIDGIKYLKGDCTDMQFPDNYFGFISCLSVIEHGVSLDSFFNHASRTLKPNGHLFVSTDYWVEPVDTYGQHAFGKPVKVFDKNDIESMIRIAREYNLHLTTYPSLECQEKVVNWIGMDYTFINLLFTKK